jgi:L-amino acid N-acyltransferase YncA
MAIRLSGRKETEGEIEARRQPARYGPRTRAAYAPFFAHQTLEDVRMRFFTAGRLSMFIARQTQIDYAREMAFVVVGAERASSWRRAPNADPDYTRVVRRHRVISGQGLGSRLMQHLIAYARREARSAGEVLANTACSACAPRWLTST